MMLWLFAAISLQGQDTIRVNVKYEGSTVPIQTLADTGFVNSSITNALNSVVHPPTDLSLNGTVLESSTGANADLAPILGSADNIYTADGTLTGDRVISLGGHTLTIPSFSLAGNIQNAGDNLQYLQNDVIYNGKHFTAGFGLWTGDNRVNGLQAFNGTSLQLYANSTAKVTVRESGNVGIGTVSPQRVLHTVGQIRLGDYGDETFSASGTHAVLLAADEADGDIVDGTNVYLKNGNVGIGTTEPHNLLHINSPVPTGGIQFTGTSTGSLPTDGFLFRTLGITGQIVNQEFGPIQFFTANANRMTLAANGNLGIGVSDAAQRLTVNGNIELANNGQAIRMKRADGAAINTMSFIGNSLWVRGSTDIKFASTGAELMTLKFDGRLGVGTTAPTEKLDVVGNVKATAFIGDGSQLTGIGGDGFEANTDDQELILNGTNLTIESANTVDLSDIVPVTVPDIAIIALEDSNLNHFETGLAHDGMSCADITAEGLDGTATVTIKREGTTVHTISNLVSGGEIATTMTAFTLSRGDDLTFEAVGGTASITISCQ